MKINRVSLICAILITFMFVVMCSYWSNKLPIQGDTLEYYYFFKKILRIKHFL